MDNQDCKMSDQPDQKKSIQNELGSLGIKISAAKELIFGKGSETGESGATPTSSNLDSIIETLGRLNKMMEGINKELKLIV